MAMVFDESMVVALAFFIFVALAYKPLSRVFAKTLDARAGRIEHELSDAIRLREEAQAMLSDYEKKYREIESESEKILAHSKLTAEKMRHDAEAALKIAIEARLAAANDKIRRAEERAVQDVQRHVVDVALEAAKKIIIETMQNDADNTLIQLALKDINRIVH